MHFDPKPRRSGFVAQTPLDFETKRFADFDFVQEDEVNDPCIEENDTLKQQHNSVKINLLIRFHSLANRRSLLTGFSLGIASTFGASAATTTLVQDDGNNLTKNVECSGRSCPLPRDFPQCPGPRSA
jgi:hypothetical protein